MLILRALSALLSYPRREVLDALDEIGRLIAESPRLGQPQKQRLAPLLAELRATDALELEERYVALFDRGRSTSLHLFEHVHGDSRDRGPAMVDLKAVYERAGFQLVTNELPDYLPAMLEFLSYRPLDEARDMLADCAHIVRALGERLASGGSGYAAVCEALLCIAAAPGLDWSAQPAPAEPHVDDDWMDAPAFDRGAERNAGTRPATAVMHFVPRKTQAREH